MPKFHLANGYINNLVGCPPTLVDFFTIKIYSANLSFISVKKMVAVYNST